MIARWSVAAALLVAACATRPQPRPYAAPTPEALLEVLRARHAAVRTANMRVKATSWLGGERVRGTVSMLVDRAGRLRFEAEIPLVNAVAALTVAGQQFSLLDFEKKLFRQGPACPANVASLVRIPLLPQEIAAILLGDAPLPAGARAVSVGWNGEADVLELAAPAATAQATSRLWIGMRRLGAGYEIVSVEGATPGSDARWRVAFEDRQVVGGHGMPGLIRFAEPGRSFDDGVEMIVRERDLNPPLDDGAFTLTPPPGFTVERVGCGAR